MEVSTLLLFEAEMAEMVDIVRIANFIVKSHDILEHHGLHVVLLALSYVLEYLVGRLKIWGYRTIFR